VLRLQGKITWIDGTGAFEAVTPANASFAVAVGESVAIPVTVTMASEGGAFDLPAAIHAATAKNSIADDDEFAISDSAASWGLKKVAWTTIRTAVSGLIATAINALGLGNSATRNVGTAAGTVAAGDDSRLSDARTPTAHKASHATGGVDALTPGDIGAEVAGAVRPNTRPTLSGIDVSWVDLQRPFSTISGTLGFRFLSRTGHNIVIERGDSTPMMILRHTGTAETAIGSVLKMDSAGSPYNANCGIRATASGELEVNNGTSGTTANVTVQDIAATRYLRPASYTVAAALALVGMPAGATIYVTNEVGGACLATYNGSAWKRQSDLATISA
jgi:hypothetical protein